MHPFASRGENDPSDLRFQERYNSGANHIGNNAPQGYSSGMTSNMSPLGMDLGEFMLEGDIEFMNEITASVYIPSHGHELAHTSQFTPQDAQNLGVNEVTGT